ncbi:glycosyltransferase family 2 protein [Pedobacter sp. BMA]|uniref:glycosyltransferase n=1 Tax=Pedobacter sp. BMA TaxID=1663685 RepID=UPI00064A0346|nr:glycosyltransferase [Pedobacter sp. BMA]KLT63764.1 family 2 glycosyl transferase [Pedobacter sp. BMA]
MIHGLTDQYPSLFLHTPNPFLRLSVIVPAKDEAEFIATTLDALRLQVDYSGQAISKEVYEVLVLANNCSDHTFDICKAYQAQYPDFNLLVENVQIATEQAHIGTVRRLLMDAAYERLMNTAGQKGIIVSTDADSNVDQQWIFQILSEMEKGVDVVGGRIIPKGTPTLAKRHHLKDVGYRFLQTRLESELDPCESNPWPRHFQCYGPSLAVTCEIYDRAGRIPAIPFLEDEEFRKALKRVDAKIRHSPKVIIYTSARLTGRVDFGFSVQLQYWKEMTKRCEHQMVESFDCLRMKLMLKKEFRSLWKAVKAGREMTMETHALACKMDFELETLSRWLNQGKYFEAVWEEIESILTKRLTKLMPLQPISDSIRELRSYFSGFNVISKSRSYAQPAIAV